MYTYLQVIAVWVAKIGKTLKNEKQSIGSILYEGSWRSWETNPRLKGICHDDEQHEKTWTFTWQKLLPGLTMNVMWVLWNGRWLHWGRNSCEKRWRFCARAARELRNFGFFRPLERALSRLSLRVKGILTLWNLHKGLEGLLKPIRMLCRVNAQLPEGLRKTRFKSSNGHHTNTWLAIAQDFFLKFFSFLNVCTPFVCLCEGDFANGEAVGACCCECHGTLKAAQKSLTTQSYHHYIVTWL